MKYVLIAVALFIAIIMITIMACCKVSGEESRKEERRDG